jgi:hypothetical protein
MSTEPVNANFSEREEMPRQFAGARRHGDDTATSLPCEKMDRLRSRARRTVTELMDRFTALAKCRNTEYVGEKVQHRRNDKAVKLEVGKSDAETVEYLDACFKDWGFTDIWEFYRLPLAVRNGFCDGAFQFVEAIAGKDAQGIKKFRDDVEHEVDYQRLIELYCRVVELSANMKAEWGEFAKRAKASQSHSQSDLDVSI